MPNPSTNPGILDILTLDDPPTLVVDTSVKSVAVNCPPGPGARYGNFFNRAGWANFQYADNIRVLSMAVVLPYCFGFSSPRQSAITLSWDEGGGSDFLVTSIGGGSGSLWVPMNNVEIPLDFFIQHTNGIGGGVKALLFLSGGVFYISMIGVPSVLDGDELSVQVMLKCVHTLPMVL